VKSIFRTGEPSEAVGQTSQFGVAMWGVVG
jgi:hypothetical protein